jgi:hypothetical protein
MVRDLLIFAIVAVPVSFLIWNKQPEKPLIVEQTWPSKVHTKLLDGTPIDICVYPTPLDDNGFVVNVHRQDDPPGRCWGTVIYPKQIKHE